MKKSLFNFTLVFALMSFSGIIVPSAVDRLCSTTPGQAAQELSAIRIEGAAELLGGICFSKNRPDIAAQIISPSVMDPNRAAATVGRMAMLNVARILAAGEPNHAEFIWATMREQTPAQPLQVEGPMKGMDAGTAAIYLVSQPSADAAAGLICALRAEQAAHVFAPGVMKDSDAQRLLTAVALRFGLTASVALNGHFVPGGQRVGANGGQIAGVAAGDTVNGYRACVAQCINDGISSGQYAGGSVSIQSCKYNCAKRGNNGGGSSRCSIQ